MMKFLSTKELEKHIKSIYAKVEPCARKDSVYKGLNVYFATGTPNDRPGSFCYVEDGRYYFKEIDVRGNHSVDIVTQNLSEIIFEVLRSNIFCMSFEYERRNRVEGQDFRKIMFEKRIEYWSLIGDDYAMRIRKEIEKALKNNPFVD